MPSRSSRANPSARTYAAIESSPATRLRSTARWISSSVGMASLIQEPCCTPRLVQEHRELWQVGIPFDQRRNRSEPGERLGVECPDFGDDAGTVIVDPQNPTIVQVPDRVPRKMDFTDGIGW